jgi:segregation and condensation protein B
MAEQSDDLTLALESVLFAAGRPVTLDELQKALAAGADEVERALGALDERLAGRGIALQRHRDAAQLVTSPVAAPCIRRLLGLQATGRLSSAALETLAVVAYRQPATRAQIEAVRGVNSDHALSALQARGLVQEIGRMETVGRPVLYGTTFEFLQTFGLKDLHELPPVAGLDERPAPAAEGAPRDA